jgi:hypothetical protein
MAVTTSPASVTEAISYDDLYARWERANWRATEIDFSQDVIDWREKLTEEQRRSALWLYTLFFHGEDAVADTLSPYIDAAPTEEQKYFLTTQQVDEARHAVFFNRFMHEVVGVGDGTIAGGLHATADKITWGHRMVFDRLDAMADELRKDRSKPKLAAAITLYHVVVEALLAQPGQHMIEHYLEEFDLLPGFRSGIRNVSLDEQRHIGFGVKLLADLYREDPERIEPAIVDVLREVLPWTLSVPKPPNWDESYFTCFNFTFEDIAAEGMRSLDQKLRAIGLPVEELRLPVRFDLDPREMAERGIKLLKANLAGPDRPAIQDPDAIEVMWDSIAHQADPRHVRPGTVIQWDFSDADAWYLTLANGATSVTRGRAKKANLTFRCTFDDWADVVAQRADPRTLMIRRRLRARGNPLVLLRLQKVMGR